MVREKVGNRFHVAVIYLNRRFLPHRGRNRRGIAQMPTRKNLERGPNETKETETHKNQQRPRENNKKLLRPGMQAEFFPQCGQHVRYTPSHARAPASGRRMTQYASDTFSPSTFAVHFKPTCGRAAPGSSVARMRFANWPSGRCTASCAT